MLMYLFFIYDTFKIQLIYYNNISKLQMCFVLYKLAFTVKPELNITASVLLVHMI